MDPSEKSKSAMDSEIQGGAAEETIASFPMMELEDLGPELQTSVGARDYQTMSAPT